MNRDEVMKDAELTLRTAYGAVGRALQARDEVRERGELALTSAENSLRQATADFKTLSVHYELLTLQGLVDKRVIAHLSRPVPAPKKSWWRAAWEFLLS